jgi:hypothetical protein
MNFHPFPLLFFQYTHLGQLGKKRHKRNDIRKELQILCHEGLDTQEWHTAIENFNSIGSHKRNDIRKELQILCHEGLDTQEWHTAIENFNSIGSGYCETLRQIFPIVGERL